PRASGDVRRDAVHFFPSTTLFRSGLCSAEADALVRDSIVQTDPAVKASLLAQAEAELTLANLYIPIGSPLRFSLVRGGVEGFVGNAWAFHPLPPLAVIPR